MRVLHVVPALFDEKDGILGGAERYAWELARHMAQEVTTTLLSFGKEDRSFQVENLRVRVLANAWHVRGNRFNPVSMRALPELRRAFHPEYMTVLQERARGKQVRFVGRYPGRGTGWAGRRRGHGGRRRRATATRRRCRSSWEAVVKRCLEAYRS